MLVSSTASAPMPITSCGEIRNNTGTNSIVGTLGSVSAAAGGPSSPFKDEQVAIDFLNQVLDHHPPLEYNAFREELKDGVLLCNLINKLRPGTIKHVGQRNLTFIKMDNITRFLQGARQLGLEDSQLFETSDLFEARNIPAVIHTIMAIAQLHSRTDNENEETGSRRMKSQENGGTKKESGISSTLEEKHQLVVDTANKGVSPDPFPDNKHDSDSRHRDVRDIFGVNNTNTALLTRPPRSPLRPSSTQRSPRGQNVIEVGNRRRISKAQDSNGDPPTSPHAKAVLAGQQQRLTMSRMPSSDLHASFLSSAPDVIADVVTTPIILGRRQSASFLRPSIHQQQQHKTESLGRKLDRHMLKTVEVLASNRGETVAVAAESGSRAAQQPPYERLSLKSKDGQTRAQYQLGNCIGKGQFGSVYRALDLSTGETVAVKRLDMQDIDQQDILQEASLLKSLSHSNVIQYIGFVPSKYHMNIILEYAEGGSLMSTLKAFGAFPEKLVASFCKKILYGLEYLHANQVVHCDLKAANILTTKKGDVKLSDFGVSLNLKKAPAVDANDVSGTPNWMAPEVIELKGASSKSDIWSLGCTLIELITGKPPYADLIAMSVMFRIVEDNHPPLPETISELMAAFLLSCFKKDPQDRPSASDLMQHPWLKQHADSHPGPMAATAAADKSLQHPLEVREFRCDDTQSSMSYTIPLTIEPITHRFISMSFGKVVECKVCGDTIEVQASLCEACALICHENCKSLAFSCPPKVNDIQPSYDRFFSAKVYNSTNERQPTSRGKSLPDWSNHSPGVTKTAATGEHHRHSMSRSDGHSFQLDDIRKYSLALGLTPREERALCENKALLSHTFALQKSDPNVVEALLKREPSSRKKSLRGAFAKFTI
ncbi:kinase-like domain-containing protein [Dichotomocladium elegans]|nr:kinase-like domain-containing protein [Dichotomocladium elegans]